MKVQNSEGVVRHVKPGDEIPEAAGWKNRKSYEKRGWIARDDAEIPEHSIKAVMASRDEEINRLTTDLEAEKLKNADVDSSSASPPETDDEAETNADGDSADSKDPSLSKSELDVMAKGSLQAIADDLGINPDQGKAKLVKAILEAQ